MARAAYHRSARSGVAATAAAAVAASPRVAGGRRSPVGRSLTCAAVIADPCVVPGAPALPGRSRYPGPRVPARALAGSAPAAAQSRRGAAGDGGAALDAACQEVGIPQVTMLSTADLERLEQELPPTAVDPGDDVFERNFPSGVRARVAAGTRLPACPSLSRHPLNA